MLNEDGALALFMLALCCLAVFVVVSVGRELAAPTVSAFLGLS